MNAKAGITINAETNLATSGKQQLTKIVETIGNKSNLLRETASAMLENNKTPDDIMFIGSVESGHSCTWDEFERLANFTYDSGYGSEEVVIDIEILFHDGARLYRDNYDGSEWWTFTPSYKNKPFSPIFSLRAHYGGNTLEDCNGKAKDTGDTITDRIGHSVDCIETII